MFNNLKKNVRPATFHRFTHKGYAIFASLGREVRIGVLSVSMLSSVCIEKIEAHQVVEPREDAETEADEHELGEVTVAGSLAPLAQLQVARIVGVMSRSDIEASAAQTINDLLKLASGVDVRQRGGFGIQTDINIDGCSFDQITILLNGVNIGNPQTGHLAADFPVSLSDIERIEILEGAASRIYGASAFGGAINIVTRHDENTNCEFGAQGGSYATFGADARLALISGEVANRISGTWQRSDGATVNSDFSRGNVYLQGGWNTEDFKIEWQGGFSDKSYGANTFYSAAYPNQYERSSRYFGHLKAESKGRVRLRPEVFWQRSKDNFELIRGTVTGENFHRTDVYGSRVTLDFDWAAGRTALCGEVREEEIYSTNLGKPISSASYYLPIRGEERFYDHHDERTNLSLGIEHNIILPHFIASFGMLANINTCIDQRLRVFPGIDLAWTPNSHWRVFASYNKGFRLPTFTDLYYHAPTHQGNIGLKPEVSHSFQLGSTLRSGIFEADAKVFYHRGLQLIDWVMYTPSDIYHSANFDLDNMGIQVNVTAKIAKFIDICRIGYTYIYQIRHDDVAVYHSNYAMEYLRHKLVAQLGHHVFSRLSAMWSFRFQDRKGSFYTPYALLDLKLRWSAKHYELWAEATNLTNTTYYDIVGVPQPGIVVLGGARLRF